MKLRDILGLPITSYDIIGDIALVHIPEEYLDKSKDIALAIIKTHPRVKTVFRKRPVIGEYRTRELDLIYGEDRTETITRENGIVLKLDVDQVFYSPRMAYDRLRISSMVKDGEHVFIPFAGIGPYAILIAKTHKNCKIIAVEKNPIAVKYMYENIKLNKVKNIDVIEGDVIDVIDRYKDWADRIIMPLPKDAHNYLDPISNVAKDKGILHVYLFVNSSNPLDHGLELIKTNLKSKFEIIEHRRLRSYSKSIDEYVFTIRLYKT